MNMILKNQSLLVAGLLPLVLFGWFVPAPIAQIDFWVLWLVAMVVVALPMVFAEFALAKRSGQLPLVGVAVLTREADANTFWRLFAWLAVALMLLLGGRMLATASNIVQQLPVGLPQVSSIVWLVGLSVLVVLASWLRIGVGVLAIVAAVAMFVLTLTISAGQVGQSPHWQVTATGLSEWATALGLALVCLGIGTGVYWQSVTGGYTQANLAKANHMGIITNVWLVWLVQVIVGVVVVLIRANVQHSNQQVMVAIYLVTLLLTASYLVYLCREQLTAKLNNLGLTLLVVWVAVVALGFLPIYWLDGLILLTSFVVTAMLAVFVGWQMKISHLRKTFNFSNELTYNLWRVAVRLVVPLACMLAVVGLILRFV